ncbi:hypothetical protein [Lapidilactobacillus luobeiensis]|nr:hypothetical protein [Lapidilactobacillus luobeiensis]
MPKEKRWVLPSILSLSAFSGVATLITGIITELRSPIEGTKIIDQIFKS